MDENKQNQNNQQDQSNQEEDIQNQPNEQSSGEQSSMEDAMKDARADSEESLEMPEKPEKPEHEMESASEAPPSVATSLDEKQDALKIEKSGKKPMKIAFIIIAVLVIFAVGAWVYLTMIRPPSDGANEQNSSREETMMEENSMEKREQSDDLNELESELDSYGEDLERMDGDLESGSDIDLSF